MTESSSVIFSQKIFGPIGRILRRPKIYVAFLAISVFVAATLFLASDLTSREVDAMEAQDLGHAHNIYTTGIPYDQSFMYYSFLHYWEKLSHSSYAFLRLSSTIFAGAAAMCIFLLLESEMGITAGLLAALFFTINPLVVVYSRLAREYGLIMGLGSACLLFVNRYFRNRKLFDLIAFAAFAVIGIYTHFFFMIFIFSIACLFLVDYLFFRKPLKKILIVSGIGFALIIPQFFRISGAVYQTHRLKLTQTWGLPHEPADFFNALAKQFFMGLGKDLPDGKIILIALLAVILIGILTQKRRGVFAAVFIFLPTCIIGWHLSEKNPIAARYMMFLLPLIAIFMASALAGLKRVYLWGPLAAAIMVQCHLSINNEFNMPPSDWLTVESLIQKNAVPVDVYAVFPRFWTHTVQRFVHRDDLAGFTLNEELDRILARAKRILIIHCPNQFFLNIDRFTKTRGKELKRFSTKVRGRLEMIVLDVDKPKIVSPTKTTDPTLILTGVIGSGGFDWQNEKLADNPFATVSDYFKSADFIVAPYKSYAPIWPNWISRLFGISIFLEREPNRRVADLIAKAGINALAIMPPEPFSFNPERVLSGAALKLIPSQPKLSSAQPSIFRINNLDVAFLNSSQHVFTDRPNYKGKNDAVVVEWENAVIKAREKIGPAGRLIVFIPQLENYDSLFADEDQMLARRAIDLGADVVMGMGGNSAKEVEEYKNGVIAYSCGTFLRPNYRDYKAYNSSGILLRVWFPKDAKVGYEVLPVYFDDKYYVTHGRKEKTALLADQRTHDPSAEHLADQLLYAKAGYQNEKGESKQLDYWKPEIEPGDSIHEGYSINNKTGGNPAIAISMTKSSGEFNRTIMFRQQKTKLLWVKFEQVLIGEQIFLKVGVPDNAIGSQGKQSQTFKIYVGDQEVLNKKVFYQTGWKDYIVGTPDFIGTRQDIKMALETVKPSDGFMVAADPVIIRKEESLQAMEKLPYKFDDHLHEAKVSVISALDQSVKPCAGPDETYRILKHEEDGPYGEGLIYHRWYCGELPWDATALTIQKSGGELRRAIWHHPLDKATRKLTYEHVTLRSAIRGYMGFTDLSIKKKNRAPVILAILVNGEKIFSESHPNNPGWKDFYADIPDKLKGTVGDIAFIVNTRNQTWRHFCFNAWME